MRALQQAMKLAADMSTLTDATTAREQLPDRRAPQATSRATKEEEQAVSTDMLGPWRPSTYDTRLAKIAE